MYFVNFSLSEPVNNEIERTSYQTGAFDIENEVN